MTIPSAAKEFTFPVLLWRKGYSYVAKDAIELCAHPRSLIEETRRRAQANEFNLADAAGRIYALTDFTPVESFGGLKRLGHILLRSVFAVPAYKSVEQPATHGFLSTVGKAVASRFGKDFAKQLEAAGSASEALSLLAERESRAG